MAKNKRAKHARINSGRPRRSLGPATKHKHASVFANASNATSKTTAAAQQKPKRKHHQPSQSAPFVPFSATGKSDILLVGEGDFSFARSLALHHGSRWRKLCAASYDGQDECTRKYPQSAEYAREIEAAGGSVRFGVDAQKLDSDKTLRNQLSAPSRQGGWDWIVFNFPHVGGLSRDQRRQVRANQELLVGFFASAKEVLRQPGAARASLVGGNGRTEKDQERSKEDDGRYHTSDEEDVVGDDDDDPSVTLTEKEQRQKLRDQDTADVKAGGRILLTLFEGLPYTLWNVRDLARHAGFVVERSFSFQATAYPGYAHARTLGNVAGKAGRDAKVDKDDLTRDGEAQDKPVDGDNDASNSENEDSEDPAEREARIAAGLTRDEVQAVMKSVVPEHASGSDHASSSGSDVDSDSSKANTSIGAEEHEQQQQQQQGNEEVQPRAGAWRGEERPARSYIFALPPAKAPSAAAMRQAVRDKTNGRAKATPTKRKRESKTNGDESDSSDGD